MNILSIEAIPVSIPYQHDGAPTGFGGTVWSRLSYLLVKVQTDDGLTGWGEAFGAAAEGGLAGVAGGLAAGLTGAALGRASCGCE